MGRGTGIGINALFNNAATGISVAYEAAEIVPSGSFLPGRFHRKGAALQDTSVEKLISGHLRYKHEQHLQHFHKYLLWQQMSTDRNRHAPYAAGKALSSHRENMPHSMTSCRSVLDKSPRLSDFQPKEQYT